MMIFDKIKNTLLIDSQRLRNDLDSYFDLVGDAGEVFACLLGQYMSTSSVNPPFYASLQRLNEIELAADALRRGIETYVYEKTLIPDLRSDVLKMIEQLDTLINAQKALAISLEVEQPAIPERFAPDFIALQQSVQKCLEHVVLASRAFFRDTAAVRDHCHKVIFCESEADRLCTDLKRAVFSSDEELSWKLHMRYFIERIDMVANRAEDLADQLVIFALKRSM
ncbi:DUF47 domain-containing protein [Crenobacter caeni]|uniref:DUF47 family protein n=1 Tax=Crenobacter caeni TaxID=2705474 RepID=A0A6B2KNV3_9NEIS|nr:DUF47 family protein [Crenobacter caeni]NDV11813.1 DUF47 family protein [Crenobacter caeni]